ncbi:MAG: hypothetical protein RLZZ02_1324 [Bacteroidota bacterium]
MATTPSAHPWSSLLRSSALVLALKVAGALGGYAFVWVAVRQFGAEGYGRFELAFTFLSLLSVVARWGFDGVLLRELPRHAPEANKVLTRGILLFSGSFAALLMLVLFSMRNGIAEIFHEPRLSEDLTWIALTLVPWTLFQVWAEHLRARQLWVGYGLLQSSVMLGATAIFMVLAPLGQAESPSFFVFAIVAASTLLWGWDFLRNDRRTRSFVSLRSSLHALLPLRATATSMFLTGTLFMVMTWSDTLMVGYFLDTESVGIYRVAFKIATLITFAQFAVNAQIAPQISAAWKANDRAGLQASVHRVALLNAALGLPAFVVLAGWGDFFLGFFSENSSDILAQTDLLRILCLGQIVNALCGPVMYLLNMTGHESAARNTMTLAVLVNVGANAGLIPILGLEGAAWATSITMSLWNVWALVAVYRKTGIRTLIFWR